MTRYVAALCLVFGATVVRAASTNAPVLTVEYSADRRVEADGTTMDGRVFGAPGKERGETTVGAITSVLIVRTDKRVAWTLMPAVGRFQEMDLSAQPQAAELMEVERVGSEIVDGHVTTKFKARMKDGSAEGFSRSTARGDEAGRRGRGCWRHQEVGKDVGRDTATAVKDEAKRQVVGGALGAIRGRIRR